MQEFYLTLIFSIIFIGFILIEDSGDDDDQGGGLMQPVYQGIDSK